MVVVADLKKNLVVTSVFAFVQESRKSGTSLPNQFRLAVVVLGRN